MKRFLLVVFAVLLLSGVGFAQQTIKIGGIFDLTGATGDVGAPYAVAARDYINYVNKQGGVNGKKIELIDTDYAYKIPQAVSAYKDQVSKGVIAILGLGYGRYGSHGAHDRHRQDTLHLRILFGTPRLRQNALQLHRRHDILRSGETCPAVDQGQLEGQKPGAPGGLDLQ